MKKTQFTAFLLSGLLALNTAIPAFAEGMTEQTAENQTQAEPYQADTEAPKLTSISIDKEEVKAPGTVTVTLNAEDASGIENARVVFANHATGREIENFSDFDTPLTVKLNVSEYEAEGNFELAYVWIQDKAGNDITYGEFGDEELPDFVSFSVTNDTGKADTTVPKLSSVSIDKEEVKAPGTVTVTLNAEDASGIENARVVFANHATGREIENFSDFDTPLTVKLNVSEYEAEGNFELAYVWIQDKAGNDITYGKFGDEELPNPLSFTVINDNNNVIPPVKPERPSKPSHSGSSSGTVVNYDSEKPDPADKKATEMYDFWQNVKRKIKNTEEGKTLRVAVPAEYTYMPASVMETLRLNPQVGLKLSWGKDTIVIKAGTAQPKQKLKAYWTKSALVKLYSQR